MKTMKRARWGSLVDRLCQGCSVKVVLVVCVKYCVKFCADCMYQWGVSDVRMNVWFCGICYCFVLVVCVKSIC